MKLLLVEDNAELAHWIVNLLRADSFEVDHVTNAETADSILRTESYDLLLLDMRLPAMSGKDLLNRLRRRADGVPVLMLTAHGSIEDKVHCFAAGADDYVVKPFDARELVARIKALTRRKYAFDNVLLICGDIEYTFDTREFRLKGEPFELRRREHMILEALMCRQGKTVSKTTLIENVFSRDDIPSADAIDIYVHRLRKRLAESNAQIMTLRGLGYILRTRGI